MKGSIATVLALCTTLVASEPASAKSGIIKIEITGGSLESPLEITDPQIVREFSIWVGPGVRINDQPAHLDPNNTRGMFIDWPKGIAAERPKGLQHYEVTFHLGIDPDRTAPSERWSRYNVIYEFDPWAAAGYFYLPGPADGEFGRNPAIHHGVEGSWFYSTPAWERLVRPLVEGASCDSQAATSSNKRPRRAITSFI
ncbi:MAG TPA: hypothetical protein VIH25_10235 [Steroidobacteraceae bacterium]